MIVSDHQYLFDVLNQRLSLIITRSEDFHLLSNKKSPSLEQRFINIRHSKLMNAPLNSFLSSCNIKTHHYRQQKPFGTCKTRAIARALFEVIVRMMKTVPSVMSGIEPSVGKTVPVPETWTRFEMPCPEVHIGKVFGVLRGEVIVFTKVKVWVGVLVVQWLQLLRWTGFFVGTRHYGGKLAVFCV